MLIRISNRLALIFAMGLGAITPLAAMAQETIGSYYAALGPQDYRNSRGLPLTSFADVLQQDRANYHRFGRRDPYDQGDPFFGKSAMRSAIPALYAAWNNGWWDQHFSPATSAPLDADVYVVICGTGGKISHLIVNYANGDGYVYCEGQVTAGD
jgi:hypothetical protein